MEKNNFKEINDVKMSTKDFVFMVSSLLSLSGLFWFTNKINDLLEAVLRVIF